MGIPVGTSSAPKMRLVSRLGIVGLTGHVYEAGRKTCRRQGKGEYKERLEGILEARSGGRGQCGEPEGARVCNAAQLSTGAKLPKSQTPNQPDSCQ